MPKYLYHYIQLFSVLGDGTKENPGGDFGMSCWIQADDESAALEWGYVLLGDYYKHRFAYSAPGTYDGKPMRDGWIESDPEQLEDYSSNYIIPECVVGEIPEWVEPWRNGNTERVEKP